MREQEGDHLLSSLNTQLAAPPPAVGILSPELAFLNVRSIA